MTGSISSENRACWTAPTISKKKGNLLLLFGVCDFFAHRWSQLITFDSSGFGFDNSGHTPELVRAITSYIRNVTPGGAYIVAGTPAHWRTAESDADRNPEFLDVWLNEFDAISPWTIGRYRDEREADDFAETKMKGDVEFTCLPALEPRTLALED